MYKLELVEKFFENNNQVSRAKGKAKGKTPKNETLKELFEANNQLQDMLGRLKLAQNKR
jgi:hypothetical protein